MVWWCGVWRDTYVPTTCVMSVVVFPFVVVVVLLFVLLLLLVTFPMTPRSFVVVFYVYPVVAIVDFSLLFVAHSILLTFLYVPFVCLFLLFVPRFCCCICYLILHFD